MKKEKMKLTDLKVKSFTTEVNDSHQLDVQGGGRASLGRPCPPDVILPTRPLCDMMSIFYVCGIKVATNNWEAQCPG